MDQSQLGGLCFFVAAVLGMVWWRLRLLHELEKQERDDKDDDD